MPNGLNIKYFNEENIEYINGARNEVDNIFKQLLMVKPHLNLSSNLKFYVNTPYYSRQSNDEWPMFDIDDKRCINIKQCIDIACNLLNVTHFDKEKDRKLLNIIIRQYRI